MSENSVIGVFEQIQYIVVLTPMVWGTFVVLEYYRFEHRFRQIVAARLS